MHKYPERSDAEGEVWRVTAVASGSSSLLSPVLLTQPARITSTMSIASRAASAFLVGKGCEGRRRPWFRPEQGRAQNGGTGGPGVLDLSPFQDLWPD
jgi:hypothetical protein